VLKLLVEATKDGSGQCVLDESHNQRSERHKLQKLYWRSHSNPLGVLIDPSRELQVVAAAEILGPGCIVLYEGLALHCT